MHVCLLTELTPCHTRRDTHTTSDSTPELPVHEPRTHPSFHPGNTQPMYAKLHAEMQPHTRYAGTYPGGRCSDPRTQPDVRGHSQSCNRGLPRDDIPSHAWTIPAHIAISHLTHIHAARRTGLGRNTESDNILAASLPWDTQHMPPSLPRTHTQQPCRSQIPYPASSPPKNP